MLVIFPFEAEIYQKAGVDVEFVGHPLDRHGETRPEPKMNFAGSTDWIRENPSWRCCREAEKRKSGLSCRRSVRPCDRYSRREAGHANSSCRWRPDWIEACRQHYSRTADHGRHGRNLQRRSLCAGGDGRERNSHAGNRAAGNAGSHRLRISAATWFLGKFLLKVRLVWNREHHSRRRSRSGIISGQVHSGSR